MEKIKVDGLKGLNVDTLIGYVFKLWVKSKRQILNELNLTGPQFDVLSAIYYLSLNRKGVIQINISEETEIDPMTVSIILRNLEKSNLIIRIRGTVNTRVKYVELTDEGASLFKKASLKMSRHCNELYGNIDEKNLTSQLIMLSNELNKIDKLNN